MFRKVEARHYKSLRRLSIQLHPFNILIGPNASGKSSFLDLFEFLQEALEFDVEHAVHSRANTLEEIVWKHQEVGEGFSIAVEADIPAGLCTSGYDRVRYEVRIRLDAEEGIAVGEENLWLQISAPTSPRPLRQQRPFPSDQKDDKPIVHPAGKKSPRNHRLVVRKVQPSGNNYFRSERTGWNISFRLSPQRLALSGLPEDEARFPVALWFRNFLRNGVQMLQLNSVAMRRPTPANAPLRFQPDGSNLPVMVRKLVQEAPQRYEWWVGHLQTILPEIARVEVRERSEDRAQYIVIRYHNGLTVPSWMLSDGTLRLLSLTLLAHLPPRDQVYLIEEPENGIHPRAVEAVYQALSSVYGGQVFIATHSPLFMALGKPEDLLVFGKTPSGATDMIRGTDHPALQDWRKNQPSLDLLFASGVLE